MVAFVGYHARLGSDVKRLLIGWLSIFGHGRANIDTKTRQVGGHWSHFANTEWWASGVLFNINTQHPDDGWLMPTIATYGWVQRYWAGWFSIREVNQTDN